MYLKASQLRGLGVTDAPPGTEENPYTITAQPEDKGLSREQWIGIGLFTAVILIGVYLES